MSPVIQNNNQDTTYLYLDGIRHLANDVKGTEKIHMGIRPYALHAGNVMSIAAYPYLLCEFTKKRGIEPKFNFIISINDWEQDQLEGPDIYKYTFDVHPSDTTIAHTYDRNGSNVVEIWQPKIEYELMKISKDFPEVTIEFIRNSSLKAHPLMRHAIFNTIQHNSEHKELLLSVTKRPSTGGETHFANALCPQCNHANTDTTVTASEELHTICRKCGDQSTRLYEDCDFWIYHKQLFAPRLAILNFDISISGADHYIEGDFHARRVLFEHIYNKQMPNIKMAFAPLLRAKDGEKMSKSRNNATYVPLEDILPQVRNLESSSLHLTEYGVLI